MSKVQEKKRSKKQNYFKKKQINSKKREHEEDSNPQNDLFMLDEEEKDHLRFLDQTYRDRAKERREAENQALDEDCSNMFLDEESSKAALKKGLDFDLFQREKEKAEVEEKENMNKEKKPEKENESQEGTKLQLPKTLMGLALRNFLNNKENPNENAKRKISINDIYYEYDLDVLFGNDMPKVIIKKSKKNKENTREICPEISEGLLIKMKKVLTYVKNKSQKMVEEKKEILTQNSNNKNEKAIATLNKNNTNLISIFDELNDQNDIFLDVKKTYVEIKPKENPLNNSVEKSQKNDTNSKRVFEELTKAFHSNNTKEDNLEKQRDKEKMLPDLLSSEQLDISKTTHSNKRLREEDIGYDECFPELDLPSLEELKNYREKHGISIKEAAKKSFADKKHYEEKKNKNKKKHLEQEAMKIKQMLQEKD